MSTICINYQLNTLRESLTRVTNDFWGISAYSFRSLTLRAFKLCWWTVETLLSRYDQIPKSRGIRSEEDGAYSSLVMKCGTFSESHFFVESFWPHVIVQSPAEKTRDGFSCSGQQCTNKDVISILLLVQFYLLDQQKKGLLPDSVTAAQTLAEAGHCFLAITRDSSSPFLYQTWSFILGVKVVFNIEFLLITENEVWQRAILNAGKKNLASM